MPRKTLMNAPKALHHVTIRGTERKPIFQDNRDKDNLVGRLGATVLDTSKSLYAWVLIPNHSKQQSLVFDPITFLCN